ncbi:DNA topoisomerase (plasmid) [Alkalihalophilus sp. As8PL]|uniref:DNA topoisomerase n=1 Tax=Alkalihalophilus sp. As8PL TaxID=3237103 RepID=A0AB39BMS7_9BACI
MSLILLAEKPSQAKAYAESLGGKKTGDHYSLPPSIYAPNGGKIVYAVGHLFRLKYPGELKEGWKDWRLSDLPIIPDSIPYTLISDRKSVFSTIKKAVEDPSVEEIVIATDPEVEGEAISRIILNHCNVKNKTLSRLWCASLTKKSIQKAVLDRKDAKHTYPLFLQGQARAIADYLIGINLSRGYTLELKKAGILNELASFGRIQTCILVELAKREEAIANFEAKPYWNIEGTFKGDSKDSLKGVWFNANIETKESILYDESLAKKIAQFSYRKNFEVVDVKQERKNYKPPTLFDLSTLMMEANKKLNLKPDETLSTLQKLYDAGYTSYPRTDSTRVTEAEAEELPDILNRLKDLEVFKSYYPLQKDTLIGEARYVGTVSDHYAIIPTNKIPTLESLSKREQDIYKMVVKRLLAAHHDDAIIDYTDVTICVDNRAMFSSKGKQVKQSGWKKLYASVDKDGEDQLIPAAFVKGCTGIVTEAQIREKKEKAPSRYTGATIIGFMRTAGQKLSEEEVEEEKLNKSEVKRLSIGTESTRAGIVKLLEDRQYFKYINGKIHVTSVGMIIYRAINPNSDITSPILSAHWEKELTSIGEGKASPATFIDKVKNHTNKLYMDLEAIKLKWDHLAPLVQQAKEELNVGPCPLCKSAVHKTISSKKGSTYYVCSAYNKTKCDFVLSDMFIRKKLSENTIKDLLNKGRTKELKGFKNSAGKKFNAILEWDHAEKKVQLVFPDHEVGECLLCGGTVIELDKFYGCSNYEEKDCGLFIPKKFLGKRIERKHVMQIIKNGKTDLLEGFIGEKDRIFNGYLSWDDNENRLKVYSRRQ